LAHLWRLRRYDDGPLDAFEIAHGHFDIWIFALEILRRLDGDLPVDTIAARLAVDRDLPARAAVAPALMAL
jgi:hypothetical protein